MKRPPGPGVAVRPIAVCGSNWAARAAVEHDVITSRGREISVLANRLAITVKALQPLLEKRVGLNARQFDLLHDRMNESSRTESFVHSDGANGGW